MKTGPAGGLRHNSNSSSNSSSHNSCRMRRLSRMHWPVSLFWIELPTTPRGNPKDSSFSYTTEQCNPNPQDSSFQNIHHSTMYCNLQISFAIQFTRFYPNQISSTPLIILIRWALSKSKSIAIFFLQFFPQHSVITLIHSSPLLKPKPATLYLT